MRKFLSYVLLLTLLLSVFAGCSGKSETPATAEPTTDSAAPAGEEGPVKLQIWMTPQGNAETYMNDKISKFNEEYAGKIFVDYSVIPRGGDFGYENKITASVASKTMPDIFRIDGPNVANYAYTGIIQPIGSYFTNEELSDFVPSILAQGTYEDQLYALGETESSVALFYNKKMLDAAGVTPPQTLDEAWTWDEFYQAVKACTKDGVYGLNLGLHMGVGEWMTYMGAPFIWSNGGDIISADGKTAEGYINSTESVEALQLIQKLASEKLINLTPTPTEFLDEGAAMTLIGTWQVAYMENNPDIEWGITYFPYSKSKVSPSGDWCWGVSSQCKYPEEAATFLKYLLSAEGVTEYAGLLGKLPARTSSYETLDYNAFPLNVLKTQSTETAHARPAVSTYPVVTQEFAKAFDDIMKGADAQERLDKAAVVIDEEIERNYP